MTADTSREAVEALIADLRPWNELEGRAAGTLAALLDERDGALAGATTLPHEAAMAGTAGEFAARWNSYRPEKREQAWAGIRAGLDRGNACFTGMHDGRIRDLEATITGQGETNERLLVRAENAEAEVDRLTAKLDAVKALCEKESGEIRTRYEPEGPYTGYANACDDVLAILADTDEGDEQ